MSRRSPCPLSEALYCQLFCPCLQSTLRWLFPMFWNSSWSIFFLYGCSMASAPFIEKTLLCPIELTGHIYHQYKDPLLDSVPLIYINVSIWCQCHVALLLLLISILAALSGMRDPSSTTRVSAHYGRRSVVSLMLDTREVPIANIIA